MTDSSSELSILKTTKKSKRLTSSPETEKNLVALCSLITLGVSSLGLLISMLALGTASTIANKPMPTLVQTADGKTIGIEAFNGKDRSPRLIKNFTVDTLTKLFNWNVYLLPVSPEEMRKPRIDTGMPIAAEGNANLKIPTPVWAASFAISDDFRKDFLGKNLAPLIGSLKILQGSAYVAFIPVSIQEPIEVKSNKSDEKLWKVKIVANLAIKTMANIPETLVPFNKDIYIRAVVPPSPPNDRVDKTTDLQAVISIARSAGLEIYGMEDFSKQDLTK
jgi:hypothetical protein